MLHALVTPIAVPAICTERGSVIVKVAGPVFGHRIATAIIFSVVLVNEHSVVNARAFHFSNRVISHWNSLSYSQVHASSVAVFRRSLTGID